MKNAFVKSLSLIAILAGFFLMQNPQGHAEEVRKPAVAGQFYPASPKELKSLVQSFLDKARTQPDPSVRAIIAPHAGFIYSGPTAGAVYNLVRGQEYDSVIIIGFSHRTPLRGVFVDSADFYETPLGRVPVNTELARKIRQYHKILQDTVWGNFPEHSVEVQVPFVQMTVKNPKIVPVYMGFQTPEAAKVLAAAIVKAIGSQKVLIIASSDCSHFYNDKTARRKDAALAAMLEKADIHEAEKALMSDRSSDDTPEACGMGPILSLLYIREAMGWKNPELVGYSNSGDITGDKTNVVGYSALAIRENKAEPKQPGSGQVAVETTAAPKNTALNADQKKKLLEFSRAVLTAYYAGSPAPSIGVESSILDETRGVFVTLKKRGALRGCIGCIIADKPVKTNLRNMSLASALEDPRFEPVTRNELKDLEIHISILSNPTPVASYQEVRLGTDGIIVRHGFKSGVFLPEVATETGWDRETFFKHCAFDKAGLEPAELGKAQVSVFQTDSFGESDFNKS